MKLATWNCCGKFETNLPHLLDLAVDVAVVCESQELPIWPRSRDGRAVTGTSRRVWPESRKELSVLARAPWSVSLHDAADSAPAWTLPVRVDGPMPFTLVGIWPVVFPGTPSYVGQVERAVDWIGAFAGEPVVLAGDFNAPIASSQAQYDRAAQRLETFGLLDAYRAARGLPATEFPLEPTYYQHRRPDRPFHIDHVFVPTPWTDGAKVEVGDFDTWIASGRSDHVPVVVEIDERHLDAAA